MVESPPADAGDAGSYPGPGISHMPRSIWAREPWPLSLRVRSLCSATGKSTTVRGPRTAKKKKKNVRLLPVPVCGEEAWDDEHAVVKVSCCSDQQLLRSRLQMELDRGGQSLTLRGETWVQK